MPDAIDEFLANYPPAIQDISRELRAIVKKIMPDANEVLYAKDNHFSYSFTQSMRDTICYICPMQDYVRYGFMYGGFLPDPHHMLVGTGKRLRHVKVRTMDDAHNPALQQLTEAAREDALERIEKKV